MKATRTSLSPMDLEEGNEGSLPLFTYDEAVGFDTCFLHLLWTNADHQIQVSIIASGWGHSTYKSVYTSIAKLGYSFQEGKGKSLSTVEWSWPLSTGLNLHPFYHGDPNPHYQIGVRDLLKPCTKESSQSAVRLGPSIHKLRTHLGFYQLSYPGGHKGHRRCYQVWIIAWQIL